MSPGQITWTATLVTAQAVVAPHDVITATVKKWPQLWAAAADHLVGKQDSNPGLGHQRAPRRRWEPLHLPHTKSRPRITVKVKSPGPQASSPF